MTDEERAARVRTNIQAAVEALKRARDVINDAERHGLTVRTRRLDEAYSAILDARDFLRITRETTL